MAQWFALKAAHPDAILFFRMGDFFEMFFADAEAASEALDIALTYRGEHQGTKVPMCGVPAHSHESYLARLIRRGFRVAIAEQMETPEEAKRRKAPAVRREVVRLVTPGTVTEETLLEASRPAWLLGLAPDGDRLGAAWLDLSTGAFETEALAAEDLPALLARLEPAEVLAPARLGLPGAVEASVPRDGARRVAEAYGRGHPRRLRQYHRRRGCRRRHGAGLCPGHPEGRGRRTWPTSPARCRAAAAACCRWMRRPGAAWRSCGANAAAPRTACSPPSTAR